MFSWMYNTKIFFMKIWLRHFSFQKCDVFHVGNHFILECKFSLQKLGLFMKVRNCVWLLKVQYFQENLTLCYSSKTSIFHGSGVRCFSWKFEFKFSLQKLSLFMKAWIWFLIPNVRCFHDSSRLSSIGTIHFSWKFETKFRPKPRCFSWKLLLCLISNSSIYWIVSGT